LFVVANQVFRLIKIKGSERVCGLGVDHFSTAASPGEHDHEHDEVVPAVLGRSRLHIPESLKPDLSLLLLLLLLCLGGASIER
jgi:hypothetical protein